ncbi:PucR family transcriptional regulator [Blautia sp. AF19-10LB]|uniref:PucR family transcriptional regulator n=1 Tax=Blautia sp. AF19-10LB TaxID=2292961 RepID=UPI0026848720|nr:helix-turn-helix domain-containing protein [Blautia sp. AF19-10LB]
MSISIQRNLQKCMEDWKQISGLDFCLLSEDNSVFVATGERRIPSAGKLEDFRNGDALCTANASCCLYKVMDRDELLYILIVWGSGESTSTIGELAVCQIRSLIEAYSEKNDKNAFMQKLLLGSYSEVEAFNRAKKLHISSSCQRAVFLVETRQTGDEHALTMIRNIFSARTHDFITSVDDKGIIIVRELVSTETYENLEATAHMLVDMLGAEAMTQAWVAYSNVANGLRDLANAYKEARMALEIGKIFYSERNVFGYRKLGIGRLIYQLPEEVCEMFIEEIFDGESLDAIDGETLNIIRTFFENNLNLSETSRQLYVHRNTLVYRFEKIQKRFGLDLRSFEDALTFKIAMLVSGYLRYRSNP